jgi:hypothetical protein
MPKRSTPFQATVRLVREHFAEPGVTVTESKFLRDVVLNVDREVDVVIEGHVDGEPITVSLEVNERGRPATLPWVQEMIQKHRNLPTNRLVLVSRSGFTQNALTAVDREAGRVQALTPEVVEVNGEPAVKRLYLETINYDATGCHINVHAGGQVTTFAGQPDLDIYSIDGVSLGHLARLVYEILHLTPTSLLLLNEAHHHPERDQVKAFSINLALPQIGYHLQNTETGELHLIESVEIWGDFRWIQTDVPFRLLSLGGRVFGSAEASIAGRPTVWVGTSDLAAQTTKISWHATDAPSSGPSALPTQPQPPTFFPGLLELPVFEQFTTEDPSSA